MFIRECEEFSWNVLEPLDSYQSLFSRKKSIHHWRASIFFRFVLELPGQVCSFWFGLFKLPFYTGIWLNNRDPRSLGGSVGVAFDFSGQSRLLCHNVVIFQSTIAEKSRGSGAHTEGGATDVRAWRQKSRKGTWKIGPPSVEFDFCIREKALWLLWMLAFDWLIDWLGKGVSTLISRLINRLIDWLIEWITFLFVAIGFGGGIEIAAICERDAPWISGSGTADGSCGPTGTGDV